MNTDNNGEIIDWNEDTDLDSNIKNDVISNELKCYSEANGEFDEEFDEDCDDVSVGSDLKEVDNSDEDLNNKRNNKRQPNTNTLTNASKELTKKLPDKELIRVNKTIKKLSQSIDKYENDTKILWDELICPFIYSGDCMILEYMSDWNFHTFHKYMEEQKVYKLMMIAHKRLLSRRNYILSTGTK